MSIDWSELFVPVGNPLELVIRGTIIYLGAIALMRILRREAGGMSRADLLFVTFIADAAQNGMAGEYHTVTEGLILVATLFGWNYLFDWLSFRSPLIQRLLEPRPLLLVRDGQLLRRNLRAEMMSLDDLHAQLREEGVESVAEVRRCYVESSGKLSVIRA